MPIEFRCSQCNQLLRVPDTTAGKSARCPKCQTMLQIPAATVAPSDPLAPAAGAPAASGSAGAAPASSDPFGSPSATVNNPFGSPPTKDPFGNSGGTSSNPFSAGGASYGSPPSGFGAPVKQTGFDTNPYASPSTAYSPVYSAPYGSRDGLPWEKNASLGNWFETLKLCITEPSQAFSLMHQSGDFGKPILFSMIGLGIGAIAQTIWQLGFAVIGIGGGGGDAAAAIGGQLIGGFIGGACGAVLGATIGMFIAAGITHLFLMMVGAANKPYETTFRVMSYTQGSLAWLQIVPFAGPLISVVWMLVVQCIGLSKAHEADIGKVILAIVLQVVLCLVLFAIVFGAIFYAVFNNARFN